MVKKNKLVIHAKPLPELNEKLTLKIGKPKLCDAVKKAMIDGAWSKVLPHIQAVDRVEAKSGSLEFEKAFAAQAMKAHLVDSDSYFADSKETDISRAITWALKAMRDENGNALDHKTRKQLALADMRKQADD